jgi:hypothetical protein
MFGRKSEEEKHIEQVENKRKSDERLAVAKAEDLARKEEEDAEAAFTAIAIEKLEAAEKAEEVFAAIAIEKAKEAGEIAETKRKADYITKKLKLTKEELLAEILWRYDEEQSLKKLALKEYEDKYGKVKTQEENISKIADNQDDILFELKNISGILKTMNRNVDVGLGRPSTVTDKSPAEVWGD